MTVRRRRWKVCLALLALCCGGLPGFAARASGASLEWRKSYGSIDLRAPVTVSPDGKCLYVGGRSLRKLDPATGRVLWSRSFTATAVRATSDGAVYAAGVRGIARFSPRGVREWARTGYYSSVAVPPGGAAVYAVGRSGSGQIYSMQVRKFSPTGRTLWFQNLRQSGWTRAEGLSVTADDRGRAYVSLWAQFPSGNADYLARYGPSGSLDWIRSSRHIRALTIGRDGNLYAAAGLFVPETCYTGYLVKHRSADGTAVWAKADGQCVSDYVDLTTSRVEGTLFVAGWYKGRVLVRQFSPSGARLWTSTYGSGGFGQGVSAGLDGSLYVSAMVAGTLWLSKYR